SAAGFSNAIVQRAVFRDHPLRRRGIVRWRYANEVEDKDDVFLRQANQRRTKRLREQGVKGYPSEWSDSIALQAGQDVAGDPFGVAAAQERQQPGLRVGPPAFRAEQIFEFSKRQGILAIGQVGDDGGAAIIRQSGKHGLVVESRAARMIYRSVELIPPTAASIGKHRPLQLVEAAFPQHAPLVR